MESTVGIEDIPPDIRVVLWLQSRFGEESWAYWNVITELGTPPVFMVVIGFLFWQGRRSAAVSTLIAILLVGLLVSVLKIIIAMPRPYYAYEMVAAWRDSDGFGMPSGHAAGAMTLWLMIAVIVRRWWMSVMAVVLVLLIGLSRMYFGVHSGTQVFAGWLLGVAVVLLVLGLRNPAALWLERANPVLLIVGAVASVLFLFGLQLFVVQPLADQFTVPTVWSERFNLAVKFEDALDAEEFRPKTMKLFDAIKLPEIGAIAGVWLILFWWKVKNHLSGEEKLVSGLPLAVTTIIGLLVTFLVVNFIALAEGYLLPSFVIWASVPALLAVAVPFLSQWIVLRTIKDQPQ